MEEKFKTLKIIHLALVAGLTIAYFILGDLLTLHFFDFDEFESSDFLFLLIPLGVFILGNYLYKSTMRNVDSALNDEAKVGNYQTACILRWSVIEGAAFFILISKPELILLGLLLIIYMFLLNPTQHKMITDFKRFELS